MYTNIQPTTKTHVHTKVLLIAVLGLAIIIVCTP